MIDLCLSAFPWATFRQSKGAIKLHIGLNGDAYLPEFVDLTRGKTHKIAWARTLNLPKGSMAVFDLGLLTTIGIRRSRQTESSLSFD